MSESVSSAAVSVTKNTSSISGRSSSNSVTGIEAELSPGENVIEDCAARKSMFAEARTSSELRGERAPAVTS